MDIIWKEIPKKKGDIDIDLLQKDGFYDDGYEFPPGLIFKLRSGETYMIGNCDRGGGYSDEWHYSIREFTHYSTSLIDLIKEQNSNLYSHLLS